MIQWVCEWQGIEKLVWAKNSCEAMGLGAQLMHVCAWEVVAKIADYESVNQEVWDGHVVCAA
tara:strand:+ start:428 stop:613 length:186 start_codon:yes stop_codon:yes gene_type:complete